MRAQRTVVKFKGESAELHSAGINGSPGKSYLKGHQWERRGTPSMFKNIVSPFLNTALKHKDRDSQWYAPCPHQGAEVITPKSEQVSVMELLSPSLHRHKCLIYLILTCKRLSTYSQRLLQIGPMILPRPYWTDWPSASPTIVYTMP